MLKNKLWKNKILMYSSIISTLLSYTFIPNTIMAATTPLTFQVTANVDSTCTVTPNLLAFGAYTGAAVNTTTTIGMTCSNGTTYKVYLNSGANAQNPNERKMKNTGDSSAFLQYGLYKASGTSAIWGSQGDDGVTGTGSGTLQPLTVYGNIPAGQNAKVGAYSDTITVTVTIN